MNQRCRLVLILWVFLLVTCNLKARASHIEVEGKKSKSIFIYTEGVPFVVLKKYAGQHDTTLSYPISIDAAKIDYSGIQKRFGIKIANILHRGQKAFGSTQTRSLDPAIFVALAISPTSGCKLEFVDSKGLIDPCGGNIFDSRGCTTNDCNSSEILMVPNYSLEDGNVLIDNLSGQEIVDFSPNIEALNISANEKIFEALVWKKKCLAEKLLFKNKGLFDYVNANNTSFIHIASANGYYSLVQTLIKRGADVNIKTDDGYTPLYFSVSNGWKEISTLLLAQGADKYSVCNQLRGDAERLKTINCN
jgi:hypothetical protein